jgi:hypothetical protein
LCSEGDIEEELMEDIGNMAVLAFYAATIFAWVVVVFTQ